MSVSVQHNLWPLAFLDLVEDRHRSRIAAVSCIACLYIAVFSYTYLDANALGAVDASNASNASEYTADIEIIVHSLTSICITENICSRVGGLDALDGLCNSTSFLCLGSAPLQNSSLPPPPPSNETNAAILAEAEQEITSLELTIACSIFLLLVLVGNVAFHPATFWLPVSGATALTVVVVQSTLSAGNLDAYSWVIGMSLTLAVYGIVASVYLGRWLHKRRRMRVGLKEMMVESNNKGDGADSAILPALFVFKLPFWGTVDLRPFDEQRHDAFFTYTRRLVNQRYSSDHPVLLLRRGLRDGSLTLAQRRGLEKAIRRQREEEFRFFAQFQLSFRGGQAFFWPTRLIAALVCSLFATTVVATASIISTQRSAAWCFGVYADATVAQSLLAVAGQVYHNATTSDLANDSYAYVSLTNMLEIARDLIRSLGEALESAAVTGAVFGSVVSAVSWVVLMVNFRSSVIMMRRGIHPVEPGQVLYKHAFSFFGASVSNSLITFITQYFLWCFVVILFGWQLTQWMLLAFLNSYGRNLLIWGISYLTNYILTYVISFYLCNKRTIKRRHLWMAYDAFQLPVQMVTGLTTAITRVGIAFGIILCALPRMDSSLCPAWVNQIYPLDSLAKSYHAVLLMYHQENNPVAYVACQLLMEAAKKRAASQVTYLLTYTS